MIKFIVVDNNAVNRTKINKTIIKNMMPNRIEFKVYEFDSFSKDLLKCMRTKNQLTVYFINSKIENTDGIDIVKLIRNKLNDWNSPIILLGNNETSFYKMLKLKLQILDCIMVNDSLENEVNDDVSICLNMLNEERYYKYTYKNVEYTIRIDMINYIQRDGRKTRIVTSNKEYFQNISINQLSKILPYYFIISAKGTLLNMKNIYRIDWNKMLVYFVDGSKDYLVTYSHKKEIDNFKLN